MLQSMSRNANCWDAPMETFFKTLKVERVHQLRYETRAQARLDIVGWSEGLLQSSALPLGDRVSDPGEHGIAAHGCVAWCTSNRGRINDV
jgi:hypothetical protein